jgi:TolA-binding protein
LSLDAVLLVDQSRLKAVSELPEEVGALVLLFDGVRSLREVVLASGTDEVLALEGVARLANLGVLVRRGEQAQAPERDSRVRALHPVADAPERAGAPEPPLSGDPSPGEGRPAASLFESTETLDQTLLRQLSAFRIRPVADRMDTVPASPELTAFVRQIEPPHAREPAANGSPPDPGSATPPDEEDAPASAERAPETSTPRAPELAPAVGDPNAAEEGAPEPGREPLDDSDELAATLGEEESFAAELEKIVAPERPPDRRWLILGVIGTAAVAVLAGLAVVISTRPPAREPAEEVERPAAVGAAASGATSVQEPSAPAEPPKISEAQSAPAPSSAQPHEHEQNAGPPAPAPQTSADLAARSPAPEPGASAADAAPPAVQKALYGEDKAGAPDDTAASGRSKAKTALARGMRLYKSGRHAEAIAVLEDVTRDHPRLAPAWVYLGLARFDGRDNEGAEQAAHKALAIAPRNGRALMLLASIHLDSGEPEKAREELQRYLDLYPNGPFAPEARQLLLQH